MQVLPRRARAALAGLTTVAVLAVPMASQANAATTTVKLHPASSLDRFLTADPSGLARMLPTVPGDQAQQWRKTDTNSGFATYTNVKTGNCLTGRGLQGFPVVTVEKCFPGATRQEWNLGVSGDFRLRLNRLIAQVNLSSPNQTGVVMGGIFTNQPNQKWHTHPA